MLSHSGRTSELVDLPARFQSAGCSVVSITGDASSPLSTTSDFVRRPDSLGKELAAKSLTYSLLFACQQTIAAEAHDNPKCPVPSRSIVVQVFRCVSISIHQLSGRLTAAVAGYALGGALQRHHRAYAGKHH